MSIPNQHTLSPSILAFIKAKEALRLNAYLCSARKLSIGWGHVIIPETDYVAFKGTTANSLKRIKADCERRGKLTQEAKALLFINPTQAQAFFNGDTRPTAELINSLVRVELTQNQFDALCCLTFNIGHAAFAGSTLRRKLNAGDYAGAAAQFDVWNKETVNGKKTISNGLVTRRAEERALFEKL